MSYRYLTYFKLTTNNQNFQIDIPLDVDLGQSRFVVSGVIGKIADANTPIYIHSPELTSTGSWSSIGQRNDTLNSCVLTTDYTKPINTVTSSQDIGFVTPIGLAQNRRISFQIRDIDGALYGTNTTDTANNKITAIVITVTFYSIGPQQSTGFPSLQPLYNYL
jgi:hypothetical protein